MTLKERVELLEKKVEMLERGSRKKSSEVADWIVSVLEKRKEITVRRLYELGEKEGYKYQTLQIARRHYLDEVVGVEHRKGKGWMWVLMSTI